MTNHYVVEAYAVIDIVITPMFRRRRDDHERRG